MKYTALKDWDNGPFGSIRRLDSLDETFRVAIDLLNFTEKELSAHVPKLSAETRNEFCKVLNSNPQLADRKELNIPNGSPYRYTLTKEGMKAIKVARKKLIQALNPQRVLKLDWNKPGNSGPETPRHA